MWGRWRRGRDRSDAAGTVAVKRRPRSSDREEMALGKIPPMMADLADRWSVPKLTDGVRVVPSSRMTRALARAYPRLKTIRISTRVLELENDAFLREIVVHEAAHLACYLKHGARIRPHGREWQELVRQAGYEPRVCFDSGSVEGMPAPRQRPRVYQHRCPVCHWTHLARTTNRRWRCAICVRAGREGRLVVRKVGGEGTRFEARGDGEETCDQEPKARTPRTETQARIAVGCHNHAPVGARHEDRGLPYFHPTVHWW